MFLLPCSFYLVPFTMSLLPCSFSYFYHVPFYHIHFTMSLLPSPFYHLPFTMFPFILLPCFLCHVPFSPTFPTQRNNHHTHHFHSGMLLFPLKSPSKGSCFTLYHIPFAMFPFILLPCSLLPCSPSYFYHVPFCPRLTTKKEQPLLLACSLSERFLQKKEQPTCVCHNFLLPLQPILACSLLLHLYIHREQPIHNSYEDIS